MAKFLCCQLKLAAVDKTLLKQWAQVKLKQWLNTITTIEKTEIKQNPFYTIIEMGSS